MQKETYHIAGMHCRACELRIESFVAKVPGVQSARANQHRGTVDVIYEGQHLSESALGNAVAKAGYRLGTDSTRPWLAHNPIVYFELLFSAVLVSGIYLFFRSFDFFGISLARTGTPTFGVALTVGLTAGISTCMAVVGGLIAGFSARFAEDHPEATARQKFVPHVFFNIGRICGYIVLGGLIGVAGSALRISTQATGVLTALAGLVMLLLGLQLIEIFPRISNLTVTLPSGIARLLGLGQGPASYSHRGAVIVGALTFFVPCGFTQAMQIAALGSGSAATGALIMGGFAVGTMPGLLAVGGITAAVRGSMSRYLFKVVGITVIALGFWNISNGYNLTGISILRATSDRIQQQRYDLPSVVNGEQTIRMTQNQAGYAPNQFTVKRGIPVRWLVTSTNPYSCAVQLVVPTLNINKILVAGENVITFTPQQEGLIKFSCGMGMYRGYIRVVN